MSIGSVVLVVLAAALGYLVPGVIGALPEPVPTQLPADPANDSPLQAQLRAEGPKEPYATVARIRGLRAGCTALCAVLAAGSLRVLGNHPCAWGTALLGPALVLLGIVDWRTRLLPRRVVLAATGTLLAALLVELAIARDLAPAARAVAGMTAAWLPSWVLWRVRPGSLGFGDVRLAALIGLWLGRLGWNYWLLGFYAGIALFALFGIGVIALRRERRVLKMAFPFGPFVIAGAYIGLIAGGQLHLL